MTTITTATLLTGEETGRRIVRDSTGMRHVANVQTISAAPTITIWRSSNGTVWSEVTTMRVTGSAPSLFLTESGRLFLVYVEPTASGIAFRHCGIADTAWSSATTLFTGSVSALAAMPDIVAHREGGTDVTQRVHVVFRARVSGGADYYASIRHVTFTINGSTIGAITETILAGPVLDTGGGIILAPSIDFHHTGDGLTIQGATPHLYVSWLQVNTGPSLMTLWFRKATYTAGAWSWGATRNISAGGLETTMWSQGIFDGQQYVMAACWGDATSFALGDGVWQRDAADTTTTTLLANDQEVRPSITFSFYTRDVWIAYTRRSDDAPYIKRYDRTLAAWQTATALSGATTARAFSFKRGSYTPAVNAVVEVVYGDSSGNPYTYDSTAVPNVAPNAPAWLTPVADGLAADVAAALPLSWLFSDPANSLQGQQSYAVRRQIGVGSYEYWNATTGLWGGSETQNVSATQSVSIPSGWGAGTDANHKYAVKTWDDGTGNLASAYSAERTVVPSAKVNPTITTPADGGTVVSASTSVTWTVAEQSAYLVQLLNASDVEQYTTGWVFSSATTVPIPVELTNGATYKARVTTRNLEGLDSTADVNTFDVDYEPPPAPTVVLSLIAGAIRLTVTNPAPTGLQPDFLHNDIYVRVASDSDIPDDYRGEDGIRIATLLTEDIVFEDYAAASGVDYEYRIRAFGENQTYADSAWT